MKPTKLTEHPYMVRTQTGRELIFPTDAGLLTKFEVAQLLDVKPGTFYERYRRRNTNSALSALSSRLFCKIGK